MYGLSRDETDSTAVLSRASRLLKFGPGKMVVYLVLEAVDIHKKKITDKKLNIALFFVHTNYSSKAGIALA